MTKDNYYESFKAEVKSMEPKAVKRIQNLYRKQYRKAAMAYSHDKTPQQIAEVAVHNEMMETSIKAIYKEIFVGMGLWYREHETLRTKGLDEVLEEIKRLAGVESEMRFANSGRALRFSQQKAIIKTIELFRKNKKFLALGEQQLGAALVRYFDDMAIYQARRIVRTEATYAANSGALKMAEMLFPGRQLKKRWLSANNPRTRRQHRTHNGKFIATGLPDTVGRHDLFVVGGEAIRFPGAGNKPSNNINCRCVLQIVRK